MTLSETVNDIKNRIAVQTVTILCKCSDYDGIVFFSVRNDMQLRKKAKVENTVILTIEALIWHA